MAPIVIAHRGASGYRPEHTLAAYELAIRQGADFIEPDLVSTRDGVLVARHENEISATTDVADHPEFAARRSAKVIDGIEHVGWFTEDFALAELQTLRARERLPDLRPANVAWNGRFAIATFQEILELAGRAGVGVYPETKHPSYFAGIGLPLEVPLVAALGAGRPVPVFIQSFEAASLARLRTLTDAPLVQLWAAAPLDLAEVASYADGIGVHKDLVFPRDAAGRLGTPTSLVHDAHALGLVVHAWTFRAEPVFLPTDTDAATELMAFAAAGIDGVFADQPDLAVRALRPGSGGRPGAGTTSR